MEKRMEKRTIGAVLSVKRQWWLKVNTKPIRMGTMDGAAFPHVIRVKYTAEGREIIKRKWLGAGVEPPQVNSQITVIYREEKPTRCRLEIV
jgi:hypothetical protein